MAAVESGPRALQCLHTASSRKSLIDHLEATDRLFLLSIYEEQIFPQPKETQ